MSKDASTEDTSDLTSLEGAMLRLKSLSLGNSECSSTSSIMKSPSTTKDNADKPPLDKLRCTTFFRATHCTRSMSRFKPYAVPKQLRRLSTPALSSRLRPQSWKRRRSLSEERLQPVVLNLDEDAFPFGLPLFPLPPPKDANDQAPSSSLKSEAQTSCRQSCSREISWQAKPVASEDDGEMEELTAYFDHFVNVVKPMSDLAQSMYV